MADGRSQPRRWSIPPHQCFYLFLVLVLLIVLLPVFDRSKVGQQWFSIVNLLVLVTSLVAVGRSRYTLLVAILLAAPALPAPLAVRDDRRRWVSGIVLALLRRGPRRNARPATALRARTGGHDYRQGVRWSRGVLAARSPVVLLLCPCRASLAGSLEGLPSGSTHVADMVFFSFGTLTTGGLADIVPRSKAVHALVILEELTGTLFMAVVVARLVASYPRQRPTD